MPSAGIREGRGHGLYLVLQFLWEYSMTAVEADATSIFADARYMRGAALERMTAGDIRDATEKAWCATMRATEALVLARTGEEPATSTAASRRLRALSVEDPSLENLAQLYSYRQEVLHASASTTTIASRT